MNESFRLAVRVSCIYLVIGIGWILVSDRLVLSDAPWWFQTVKGSLYVIVTALLLYWLVMRGVQRISAEEARYFAVFKTSPHPIIVADDALRILSMNPSALAFYHRKEGFTDHTLLSDLWAPDEREAVAERLHAAMNKGGSFEARQPSDTGKVRQVVITVFRLTWTREPLNLFFVQDLTEWREQEAQIKSLNRTHTVLSSVNQAITRIAEVPKMLQSCCRVAVESGGFPLVWIGLLDRETRVLKVVASAGDTDGYLEAMDKQCGGPAVCGCAVDAALREGRPRICPITLDTGPQLPCKRIAWGKGFRASVTIPLRFEGQDVKGVIALYASDSQAFNTEQMCLLDEISMDIAFALEFRENQRKREAAKVALSESEDRFRLLVENAPDAVFVEAEGRVAYLNEAMFRLIGAPTMVHMIGRDVLDLVHPQSLEAVQKRLLALHRDKQTFRLVEDVLQRFDGSTLSCEMSAVPFRVDGKDGALVFMRDVSQRNRVQEHLRQAQKMEVVGQLAGGVAHDFNNLLQVINGASELAFEAAETNSPVRELLTHVRKAGKSAADLVGQLLVFSRRQLLHLEQIELNEVFSSTIHMLERVIGVHIQMQYTFLQAPLKVCGDRSMLEQVLINLCINARDAMAGGGVLSISTESVQLDDVYCNCTTWARPGNYAVLSVTDTGCGISKETQEHMFEPFFTTKKEGFGMGLGLATVYSIVKQHDGLIQVVSESGKGTRFSIYLPMVKTPSASVDSEQASGVARKATETLLFAEDDNVVRKLTAYTLRTAGYTVIEARDGVEALDLFRTNIGQIAGVVLDVIMPRMGGFETYDQIIALAPQVPVIFATAFSEQTLHTRITLSAGVNLLQKPFDRNSLLGTVRRILDAKRPDETRVGGPIFESNRKSCL